jgi:hypothetical protein
MTQTHKTYGLVIALVMIVINVVMYLTNLSMKEGALQYISYIPFLIGIILNANAFSKANDGYVSFGSVFSSGFKASAITTLILTAWTILSVFLIFPEMKEKSLEMAAEQMANDPKLTQEQIDTALGMTEKFLVPFMIGGVVFMTMFFGAIFSLIAAAITKKKGLRTVGMQ